MFFVHRRRRMTDYPRDLLLLLMSSVSDCRCPPSSARPSPEPSFIDGSNSSTKSQDCKFKEISETNTKEKPTK